MIYAAIDLGTVTSRLMISTVNNGCLEIIEERMVITDLGEGLSFSGVISEAAFERLFAALMQFKELMDEAQDNLPSEDGKAYVIPVKAIATSAMRDAKNADELLSRLKEKGFFIEVISGRQEAELSFKGTLSGFSDLNSTVITVDVGGGSTELILGTNDSKIVTSRSFDIGCRRVTELFLKSDPPSAQELCDARAWIEEQIEPFLASLSQRPTEMIAVAGTATSALTIRDGIDVYDRDSVHGKTISAEELDALVTTLASMNLDSRKLVSGLDPKRASVIVGGLVTLAAVLNVLGMDTFLVSDTDILQGIILDAAAIC